ncbi:hypothetical protein N9T51_02790 [Pseudomonadota bacterium]|nr:hypothetical protein [Pseudomonadota bacterium]
MFKFIKRFFEREAEEYAKEFMLWMKREKKMVGDFRDVCVAKEIPHEFLNFM